VAVVVIGDKPIVTYLPPAMVRQSALDLFKWEQTLPPSGQAAFARQAQALIKAMTPMQRSNVAKYLAANGLPLAPGLGQFQFASLIGPLTQALSQTGAAIFSAQASKKAAEQTGSQADATQAQIAQIQSQAALQAAQIQAGATVQAAQTAAGADVSMQQTKSQATVDIMPTVAKWGAIAAGGVVFLVLIAMLARRGRSSSGSSAPAPAPAPAPAAS
jgi:hypothetical protein